MINTLIPIFITMEIIINPISRGKEVHWIFEALTAQHWSFLPRLKELPESQNSFTSDTVKGIYTHEQHSAQLRILSISKTPPKKGKIIQSWPSVISSKSSCCSCHLKHENLFPTFKITSFPCQVFLLQVNTSATGNALTANNIILNLVNKQSLKENHSSDCSSCATADGPEHQKAQVNLQNKNLFYSSSVDCSSSKAKVRDLSDCQYKAVMNTMSYT